MSQSCVILFCNNNMEVYFDICVCFYRFWLSKMTVLYIKVTAECNLFFFFCSPGRYAVFKLNIVIKMDSQISEIGKLSIPNIHRCFLTDKRVTIY